MAHSARQIDWYRTPLAREDLKRFTKRSNAKGLAQTLGYLAVLAATALAAALAVGRLSWHFVLLLFFLHGTISGFHINGFHELVHGTVFRTRALNRGFLYILSFLGWYNPFFFHGSHTRHHKYTLHPPEDREVLAPMDMTVKGYLAGAFINPMLMFVMLADTARNATGKVKSEWQRDIFAEDPEGRRKLFAWARILLFGHVGVVALGVATGLWYIPVLITLAPFYGNWLQPLCNQTQHIGLPDKVPDYRLCCRTMLLNPLLQFLYWNMNFHTEHHMYAAVPCYNLPALHRAIRHDLPPSTRGLYRTWKEIAGILKRQKTDGSYAYYQPLPGDSPTPQPT